MDVLNPSSTAAIGVDWNAIEAEYRAGGRVLAIAKAHGVSHVSIYGRINKHGWKRDSESPPQSDARSDIPNVETTDELEPIDPEHIIGTAALDGEDGDLAVWPNPAGNVVIVWDRDGWSHQREHLILDLPTAVALIKRVRQLAADIASTISNELRED